MAMMAAKGRLPDKPPAETDEGANRAQSTSSAMVEKHDRHEPTRRLQRPQLGDEAGA